MKVVYMFVSPHYAGPLNTEIPNSLLFLFNLPFFHLSNFVLNIFLMTLSSFK